MPLGSVPELRVIEEMTGNPAVEIVIVQNTPVAHVSPAKLVNRGASDTVNVKFCESAGGTPFVARSLNE